VTASAGRPSASRVTAACRSRASTTAETRCRATASQEPISALPDFHRVVFDPAGLRVDLFVFLLVDTHYLAGMIEDHEASAGSALINCCCIFSHFRISS
jgi:hypothetical protein